MPDATEHGPQGVDTTALGPAFVWGAATAAYQIEGGAAEGGRGRSIWDTFSHTPGRTLDGDTGDVADDHYHRWREDIALMGRLGLDAYRFSVSWPRVQPGGMGDFNPEGIRFYRELAQALRDAGIRPVCTLYHWDLPQELEDGGGWTHRGTAYAFERYAEAMARELGDLVDVWTTLNEPWCTAYAGYAEGVHAPGRTDPVAALAAVHHLNLAHGLGVRAIRRVLGPSAVCSVTLNLHLLDPADPARPEDVEVARRLDAVANRAFLGPMLQGAYPADLLADTAHLTDWPWLRRGDLDLICQPLDVLGVNYYSRGAVTTADAPAVVELGGREALAGAGGYTATGPSPWVGCDDVVFLPGDGPHTAMNWLVAPEGLTELLVRVASAYPGLPLMVTENGSAWDGDQVVAGRVHDPERVAYLHDHVAACVEAVRRGVDLRGYFAWSLLDNFEWAFGYSKRFGIVYVDYDTLGRTVKDSGLAYAGIIAAHRTAGTR